MSDDSSEDSKPIGSSTLPAGLNAGSSVQARISALLELNFTVDEIGHLIGGISSEAIKKWRRGEVKSPHKKNLARLDTLRLTVKMLSAGGYDAHMWFHDRPGLDCFEPRELFPVEPEFVLAAAEATLRHDQETVLAVLHAPNVADALAEAYREKGVDEPEERAERLVHLSQTTRGERGRSLAVARSAKISMARRPD